VKKLLDLFCGAGGWSAAFSEAGYHCTGVDFIKTDYPYDRFIKADLNDWTTSEYFDVILSSPPCTNFSKVVQNWNGQNNEMKGLDLVWRTYSIIQTVKPKFWMIENVQGLENFLGPFSELVRYGLSRKQKTACLWSNIGSLGFFDYSIDKKTSRKTFKRESPELAKIPYSLSHQVLKKIQVLENEIPT